MWCTAPLFHAAGRKIYQRGEKDFVALSPPAAEKAGLADKVVRVFDFEPMRADSDQGEKGPTPTVAPPRPGTLLAVYWSRTEDRVGTVTPEPDGIPDCCVRIAGVRAQTPVKNLVLTGPKQGRWEYIETGRWWRLAYQRHGELLDCYFQFYAPGEHQIEIHYEGGGVQSAKFQVPNVAVPELRVDLESADPNGFVFHAIDPEYPQILASCLKNLLADLDR